MSQNPAAKNKYGQAFVYAFLMSAFLLLPIIIYSQGILIYSDEFNKNVIVSLLNLSSAVSEGLTGFDTVSGETVLNLLFENGVFSALTAFIPKDIAVYIIPLEICLKFGFSSLAAYSFISRNVKNPYASLTGAIIYSFSGFQLYALNYGSFIDIMIFFPLLLIAAEKTFFHKKYGMYALCLFAVLVTDSTLLLAVVLFTAIYLTVRYMKGGRSISKRGIFGIILETAIAVMISAIVLIPSLQEYFDSNEFLFGGDILAFSEPTHIWQILASAILPSEPLHESCLFDRDTFGYSLYLPVFGISGAVSFIYCQQKHWASKIFVILTAFLFIPVLNSVMSFMNISCGADWLFMLVLMLSLMTAYAIDDTNTYLSSGIKFSFFMLAMLLIYAVIPQSKESGIFSTAENLVYLCISVAAAFIGLLCIRYIFRLKRTGKPFLKNLVLITVCLSMVSAMPAVYCTVYESNSRETVKNAISAEFDFECNDFFRIALPDEFEKTGAVFGYPYVTFSEYAENSKIYAVKYFVLPKDESVDFEGVEYLYTESGFAVYENTAYEPIGTAFELNENGLPDMSAEISTLVSSSSYENGCCSLEISLLKDGGVVFSLPYNSGFSATVNGKSAEILKASDEFFFVKVESGLNDIKITYKMSVSYEYYISFAGIVLYLVYLAACTAFKMTDNIDNPKVKDVQQADIQEN